MDLSFASQFNAMIWLAKNGKGISHVFFLVPSFILKPTRNGPFSHGNLVPLHTL